MASARRGERREPPAKRGGGARPAGAADPAREVVGVDQLAAARRTRLPRRGGRGGHRGGGAGLPRRRAGGCRSGGVRRPQVCSSAAARKPGRASPVETSSDLQRRWGSPGRALRPLAGREADRPAGPRAAPARATPGAAGAGCASTGRSASVSGQASASVPPGSGGRPSAASRVLTGRLVPLHAAPSSTAEAAAADFTARRRPHRGDARRSGRDVVELHVAPAHHEVELALALPLQLSEELGLRVRAPARPSGW